MWISKKMSEKATVSCMLVLLWVNTASSQSESSCPMNSAMGLCTELATTCFSDKDCYNGEICCPEACSRTCKSRNFRRATNEGSIPDLLNDPRVYVGKCPDASCYNMFGGDANECSTTRLCPGGQFCCNDGCKNVCQWKPQYAALIAQEQAKARRHQQMIIQKQQEEMRRRHQEMYIQRQRQMVSVEQARKRAEARAAAEAELMAQQKRAAFEANLRAAAGNQAKLASRQHQQTIAQLYPAKQQTAYQATLPSGPTSELLNNFDSKPQTNSTTISANGSLEQQQTAAIDISGSLTPIKKDNLPESFMKHINSPASRNPHNFLSQQDVAQKTVQEVALPSIQSAVPISRSPTANSKANPGSVIQIMTNPQNDPFANLGNVNSRQQASLLRAYPNNQPHQSSYINPIQNGYPRSSNAISTFTNNYLPFQAQNSRFNPLLNQSPTQVRQQIHSIPTVQKQSPSYTNQQLPLLSSAQNQSPAYSRQQLLRFPYQDLKQGLSHISQSSGRVYQRQATRSDLYRAAGQRQQQQQQQQPGTSLYRGGQQQQQQQPRTSLYRGGQQQQGNANTYLMYEMMQTAL